MQVGHWGWVGAAQLQKREQARRAPPDSLPASSQTMLPRPKRRAHAAPDHCAGDMQERAAGCGAGSPAGA